ncbi:MAG: tRNA (N(6)-L-threonylcarbamoyladenosine(37)-C(2))-methylthiotransferase MtaB [Candidatus Omnitrophota bacterium]
MPTVKFLTLGCKVNQYETQALREQFIREGFIEKRGKEPADFYVINTCTVTGKADRESLYLIRRSHRENPFGKIVVTGCLAELDKDVILGIPGVSLIQKNSEKDFTVSEVVGKLVNSNRREGQNKFTKHQPYAISHFEGRSRAFLKIQDGCNNRCAYCKVPLVRGNSKSRPLRDIIEEAQRLVKNGFKEIVLTGICLGSYGKDLNPRKSLIQVISKLEKMLGLYRIRLSSIEARDINDALIRYMRNSKRLCRHLHIPFQSGDDAVLESMKRNYTHKYYVSLAQRLKKQVTDIAITTDIIVGFPGETESAFNNTLRLIKEILPLKVHIFPYSDRKGTFACRMQEKIQQKTILERKNRLFKVSESCALEFKKQFIGKSMEALIDSNERLQNCLWTGYTSNYIRVAVKSKTDLMNAFISLSLKRIDKNFIFSKLT